MAILSPGHSKCRRFLKGASGLLFLSLLSASCANDMEKIEFFGRKELPYQIIDSASVVRSSEGNLQMVMDAPHIEVYKNPENKTVCPQGVKVTFYDALGKKKAFLKGDYGISYDDRKMMEVQKNVVIIDYHTGDTSYLADLIFNQAEHRIYSQHPVKSVNGPRVTMGDGFESDENFTNPQILHQRGTVLIEE